MSSARRATVRRVLSVVAIWSAATAFGLAFAVATKIGPVLWTLSRRHGVHVGDLLALLASYTVAALMTRHLLQQP